LFRRKWLGNKELSSPRRGRLLVHEDRIAQRHPGRRVHQETHAGLPAKPLRQAAGAIRCRGVGPEQQAGDRGPALLEVPTGLEHDVESAGTNLEEISRGPGGNPESPGPGKGNIAGIQNGNSDLTFGAGYRLFQLAERGLPVLPRCDLRRAYKVLSFMLGVAKLTLQRLKGPSDERFPYLWPGVINRIDAVELKRDTYGENHDRE